MEQERWIAIQAASTRLSLAKQRDEALKTESDEIEWLFEDFIWPDEVKQAAFAAARAELAKYNDPELREAQTTWEDL